MVRYSTPPEYEPPPPYHVALQIETEAELPPEYRMEEEKCAPQCPLEQPPEYLEAVDTETPLETLV